MLRPDGDFAAAAKKAARYGGGTGVPPVSSDGPGLEPEARRIAAFIQTYPKMTDADRATIGIRVRIEGGPPSPTSQPLARVESSNRLTHQLRLVDEGSPTRRGKPEDAAGVYGPVVWVKLVDAGQPAPTDPAPAIGDPRTLSFLTLTSRPTVRTEFKAADGGKTSVYMLRWDNTRGEKGPWSEICGATVAA